MATGLATRCSACGTVFRVVPDQLRVSEGWVRCGRCAEVFNASVQTTLHWLPKRSSTSASSGLMKRGLIRATERPLASSMRLGLLGHGEHRAEADEGDVGAIGDDFGLADFEQVRLGLRAGCR